MNYLAIGLIIIIGILLYYAYYYVTNTELTSGLQTLNQPIVKTYDKLKKNPNSYTYSYQCWLYISSPTSSSTTIFARGKSTPAHNNFEVVINGQSLVLNAGTGDTNAPTKIMNITDSFPIQKWTYLVINVYNLQTFEAYINGKLAKTVNVPSAKSPVPTSKTSSLTIGNSGLNGYVTKFTRIDTTLDAQTVWNTYLKGNGLSNMFTSLIPYGLNMSISKGEDVQRVVKIF
jgi:hypothetical protein